MSSTRFAVTIALVALSAGCSEEPAAKQTIWFPDCDDDGYADGSRDAGVAALTAPELALGCAAWTTRAPVTGAADCNDRSPDYHPDAGFGVADETGNGDLNCDGQVERKWRFDAAELRLDSYVGANGDFKVCDLRAANGRIDYPESLAAFVSRGQCPCYVEWVGDISTGYLKWTKTEFACSPSTVTDVIPIWLRKLDVNTCLPTGDLMPGVQRCR